MNCTNAGSNPGTYPSVFNIYTDNWLNLRTGVLTALNYSDNLIRQGGPYVFDPKLSGQQLQYGKVCHCTALRSSLLRLFINEEIQQTALSDLTC